jgi:hypothetical protein
MNKADIKELFTCIMDRRVLSLKRFLDNFPMPLNLLNIYDVSTGFNTLHQAVYSNSLDCSEVIINYLVSK